MTTHVYVVNMNSADRGEVFSVWTTAHITKRGAAGSVVLAIESLVDDDPVAMEDIMGEPRNSFLKSTFEEIEDCDSSGDAQIFEHEFNVNGNDYKINIMMVELED